MKTRQLVSGALMVIIGLAIIGCSDGGGGSSPPPPPPKAIEKTYLAPNTKVTIKYMDLASNTNLPAEISKLVKVFTDSPGTYSALNRTIFVIDGSSSSPEIQNDSTMKIGRKYVIDTAQDDLDDAIYALRASWLV